MTGGDWTRSDAAAADQHKRAAAETELNDHHPTNSAQREAGAGGWPGGAAPLLQQFGNQIEQHLDALRNLDQMRQRVQDAERQDKEWDGFSAGALFGVEN